VIDEAHTIQKIVSLLLKLYFYDILLGETFWKVLLIVEL